MTSINLNQEFDALLKATLAEKQCQNTTKTTTTTTTKRMSSQR